MSLEKIVAAMKATGNRPGIVSQWRDMVEHWALRHATEPEAQAVLAWLPHWQIRPFYTAAELAPIIPALTVALRIAERMPLRHGAARTANELEFARLPQLYREDGGRYFYHPVSGEPSVFFIVERLHFWKKRFITQQQFEEACNAQR